jgi:hypothetical protein
LGSAQIHPIKNSHCAIPENLLEYAHGFVFEFPSFFLQI